ncbi:MAG: hypothetical protein IT235_04755 [Bacteroidia bacterium]|nr:hypothetical protein [Bacteroidia bacterium]
MKIQALIVLVCITTVCLGQDRTSGNSVVFKVRSPLAKCSVFYEDSVFWLEKENIVRVKVKGRNKNVKLIVEGGRIASSDGDTYVLRFGSPGMAAVSVYQQTDKSRKLLYTKQYKIKTPTLFFCGIKLDSASKVLKMRGCHLYAFSQYYKMNLKVRSFDMYFTEDTDRYNKDKSKRVPILFKSDTCILSGEMKLKVVNFQPKYNDIYFHNIICIAPDGSKKILDPIQLSVKRDTADKKTISLIYAVQKKIFELSDF